MITLITGGPGTGKTAWIVSQIVELKKISPFRALYVHGIKDLKLAHTPIYCRGKMCDFCRALDLPEDALYIEDWPVWKSPNDLIIVDEFQRAWPASTGATLPDSISKLDTHRHHGLDFWLITQSPKIVHTNVKAMVGRHIHLCAKWSGRSQYEWPEVRDNVQSRGDAVVRSYKLPKHVYTLYKSAEVHTKQEKRKPLSLYFMIGALLIAVVLGFIFASRLNKKLNPVDSSLSVENVGARGVEGRDFSSVGGSRTAIAVSHVFPDFKPVVVGVVESAPAYAHLVKVESVPHLMGCVSTPDFCRCYTVQGTPYITTPAFCSEYIKGHYFNPYKRSRGSDVVASSSTVVQPQVLAANKNN
jgi:zona occludens toxin